MSSYCKNKFWLENPVDLFCNCIFVPNKNMKLSEQMNALTRLVLIIFFLLLPVNTNLSIVFILISLFFIIIVYYIQKGTMNNIENFNFNNVNVRSKNTNYLHNNYHNKSPIMKRSHPSNTVEIKNNHIKQKCVNNKRDIKSLSGPQNPKTLIQPYLPPRIFDTENWKKQNSLECTDRYDSKSCYPEEKYVRSGYNQIKNGQYLNIYESNPTTLNEYKLNEKDNLVNQNIQHKNIEPENVPISTGYTGYNKIPNINRSNIDYYLYRYSNDININNIKEFANESYLKATLDNRNEMNAIYKLNMDKEIPLWINGPI